MEERIRPLGAWSEDVPLFHCIHLLKQGHSNNTYIVVSLPEQDITNQLEVLQQEEIRLDGCVPHVASIAAFTGQLTHEPVMACVLANGYLEILVAEKGVPLYSQISPLDDDGEVDLVLLEQAVLNVRQIVDAKYKKIVKKLLYFDKNEENLPENIGKIKIWYPKPKFLANREQYQLAWKHPELVGTVFVHNDFNCIPDRFKKFYFIQDANRVATAFSIAGIILLGCSGIFLSSQYDQALTKYQKLNNSIQTTKEQILRKMPSPKDIKNLREIASVLEELFREPTIDSLLYHISRNIPEGVVIEDLKAERWGATGENGQPNHPTDVPPPDAFVASTNQGEAESGQLDQSFFRTPLVVQLLLLSQGDFQTVKVRLEEAADLLAKDFNLKNVKFSYKEDQEAGHLECELRLSESRT